MCISEAASPFFALPRQQPVMIHPSALLDSITAPHPKVNSAFYIFVFIYFQY